MFPSLNNMNKFMKTGVIKAQRCNKLLCLFPCECADDIAVIKRVKIQPWCFVPGCHVAVKFNWYKKLVPIAIR